MFRAPLPWFNYPDNTGETYGGPAEKFLPFIIRREQGIAVRLCGSWWPDNPDNTDRQGGSAATRRPGVVAYISVLLNQRDARLFFLARLLKALTPDGRRMAEAPMTLHHIRNMLDDNLKAFAFLSEGWGDVLMCFLSTEPIEQTILRIFDIQNAIYQDFLVDRTELILGPQCIDAVETRNHST